MHMTGTGDVGFGGAVNFIPLAKFHTEFTSGTAFLLTRSGYTGELSLSTNDVDNATAGFDAHWTGSTWLKAANATTAAFLVKNGNKLRVDRWSGAAGATTIAPTPALSIDLTNGNLSVTGDVSATGAIYASYSQDVAEWVPSVDDLPVGTVVVLDKARVNHVVASKTPYDASVAGVVTGKPAVILGRRSEGDEAIATSGRVPVEVDATEHPIEIGDLLVTSGRRGVAMKSIPMQLNGRSFHQPGTIVGKALEPLKTGRGQILVLLSLQ